MRHFIEHEGIELIHYRMEGNKEPFIEISHDDISHALVKLLDERSHPGMCRRKQSVCPPLYWLGNSAVLIHCLKGKVTGRKVLLFYSNNLIDLQHRIGCLVGCLRKIQRWSMTSIFDEYRKFADTKVLADQEVSLFSIIYYTKTKRQASVYRDFRPRKRSIRSKVPTRMALELQLCLQMYMFHTKASSLFHLVFSGDHQPEKRTVKTIDYPAWE